MSLSSARVTFASAIQRNGALAEAVRTLRRRVEEAAGREIGFRRIEVEVESAEPLAFLAAQAAGERRYFCTRDGVIAVAGVGNVASFRGLDAPEFAAFRASAPRTIGFLAQRFDDGREPSREWQGFGPSTLTVPAVELRREAQRVTLAAHLLGDGHATLETLARLEGDELPTDPTVAPPEYPLGFGADGGIDSSPEAWKVAIDATLGEIAAGNVRKIVLARTRLFRLPEPVDPCEVLLRLGENEPGTYQFLVEAAPGAAFVGASPERLFLRQGDRVLSEALAGTRPRGATPEADWELAQQLFESEKERNEHQLVLERVRDRLGALAASIRTMRRPELLRLASVQHLRTRVEAALLPGTNDADLLRHLHPTPAVCGQPLERARTIIRACEPFDRGLYAGPIGIAGATTEVCVAIRSALVAGRTVTAFAGAGVVAGSIAEAEWRETEHKLATFERLAAGPRQ